MIFKLQKRQTGYFLTLIKSGLHLISRYSKQYNPESADEQIKLSLVIESLCYNTSSLKENKCKLILNKTQ